MDKFFVKAQDLAIVIENTFGAADVKDDGRQVIKNKSIENVTTQVGGLVQTLDTRVGA
jgi:hypothetical protein